MKSGNGYEIVKIHGHPVASKAGIAFKHRLVWHENFGEIPEGKVVHHINGNKLDNRIENLELLTRSEHMKKHYEEGATLKEMNGVIEYVSVECFVCGRTVVRKKCVQLSNNRNANSTHANATCSRSCWAKLLNAYKYGTVEKLRQLKEQSWTLNRK